MSEASMNQPGQAGETAAEQIARLTYERDAARRALAGQRHERFKADIRMAVTWLHRRAQTMNDPHAQAVLNVAATDLGADLRHGRLKSAPVAQGNEPTGGAA